MSPRRRSATSRPGRRCAGAGGSSRSSSVRSTATASPYVAGTAHAARRPVALDGRAAGGEAQQVRGRQPAHAARRSSRRSAASGRARGRARGRCRAAGRARAAPARARGCPRRRRAGRRSNAQYSGFSPNGSAASVSVRRSSCQIAKANIPFTRSSATSPHSSQACSSTSPSPSVTNAVAGAAQLVAQLAVVVDLAVEDEVPGPEVQRLVGALVEVDDRQAAKRQPRVRVVPDALAVGTAMGHRGGHRVEHLGVGGRASDGSGDAAHRAQDIRARRRPFRSPGAAR